MKLFLTTASLLGFAALLGDSVQAAAILTPGSAIVGGQRVSTNFVQGVVGTTGGVNNWPAGEPPANAIDGLSNTGTASSKYLNFARTNTGFIVTPTLGSSIVTSITLYTANDSENRDPASYELWGTNSIVGGGTTPMATFTLISSGGLALPAGRNGAVNGTNDLDDFQTVAFANTTAYSSYLLLFPTVKDIGSTANSMQIAEVQFDGVLVPEPTAGLLALFAGLPLVLIRRRR